ncbi:helix-turn-helix domain-containing protein [Nonomuraea sediminis]|uniref:helix-turn-helix domain-containing protein n=1 Tax=Nonomuraea sediminis TaxID=2835864 RepID=UPI001BDC8C30|nr:helix-turn-helix domain-containing protein [Nonomuraea sediminis]
MEEREPLSDPKAMRALAHPARLAILNQLGAAGSATATEVAENAGISPSAASYHLRMLAKYGFVEDAPGTGDGRERAWRSVRSSFSVGTRPDDQPEVRAAKDMLIREFRKQAGEAAERALANLDREPEEWRDATMFSTSTLLLDASEAKLLAREIDRLLEPYVARNRRRGRVPEGARIVEAQFNIFPRAARPVPGLPTEDHDAR